MTGSPIPVLSDKAPEHPAVQAKVAQLMADHRQDGGHSQRLEGHQGDGHDQARSQLSTSGNPHPGRLIRDRHDGRVWQCDDRSARTPVAGMNDQAAEGNPGVRRREPSWRTISTS
jgi:hypothetical protein